MLIFAHRGAHGTDRPENSRASILQAQTDGVDGVEVDVRSSLDRDLILHHDRYLPDGTPLSRLSKREIEQALGHGVAELPDVIQAAPNLWWNIEVKDRSVVGRLRELLLSLPEESKVLVSSFDHATSLACVNGTGFSAGLLISHLPATASEIPLPTGNAEFLIWDIEFCSAEMLLAAERAGWKNMAYGLSSPDDLTALAPAEFVGVISDFPGRFLNGG